MYKYISTTVTYSFVSAVPRSLCLVSTDLVCHGKSHESERKETNDTNNGVSSIVWGRDPTHSHTGGPVHLPSEDRESEKVNMIKQKERGRGKRKE